MKKIYLLFACFISLSLHAQDTFSIVAVDTVTGEIGSAGASCIDESQIEGGALIISDVIPGRGAIHTQAYWNSANQQNAHDRMVEGLSPQEIIDWLSTHDSQNNPSIRQYGIVDFDSLGHARSAGFTGANCMDYKNHITGPNYSIQGNILLGQEILDSIESRFLNTQGSFAEKMMAALQGAKVVGADTRCTANGTSSLSAFVRVARPQDPEGGFYCDLNVPSVPTGMEPIDSLQTLFDAWLETVVGVREYDLQGNIIMYPNPASGYLIVGIQQPAVGGQQPDAKSKAVSVSAVRRIEIRNMLGEQIDVLPFNYRSAITRIDLSEYNPGIYFVIFEGISGKAVTKKLVICK